MEEAKKEKINYRWKVLIRLIFYTIIFVVIYLFSVKLLHKNCVYIGSGRGGLIPTAIYMADTANASKALLLIFSSMVIYYFLFKLELNVVKKNENIIFKYILLFLFEIVAIYFSFQSIFRLGCCDNSLFSTLKLDSIFLEILRFIIVFFPPFILIITSILKFITKRIKIYKKRKRIDKSDS